MIGRIDIKGVASKLIAAKPTYFVLFFVGLVVHLVLALDLFTWYDRLLAAALLGTFLTTCYQFVHAGARTAPLVPLVFFQLWVMYGAAQFTQQSVQLVTGRYIPSHTAVTTAMALVVAGELCFIAGQRIGLVAFEGVRKAVYHTFATPAKNWSRPAMAYATAALVFSFLRSVRPNLIPLDLRNVLFMVVNPYLAQCIVLVLAFRYEDRACRRYSLFMLAALVVLGLLGGMLENTIVPIYALATGAWIWGGRVRVGWLAAAVLIFVALNPVKANYRQIAWHSTPSDPVVFVEDRLGKWVDAFVRTWSSERSTEQGVASTTSRLSALTAMAQMVDWVPSMVPYKNGDGFLTTILFMVPRVIWPEKPNISDVVNNRYAVEFRIATRAGTRHSTFGVFQPADGYWDFGAIGALAYPGLLGLVFALLFSPRRDLSVTEQIMAMAFSCNFFQSVGSLFNVLASLFTLFAGAWIALRLLSIFAPSAPEEVAELEAA